VRALAAAVAAAALLGGAHGTSAPLIVFSADRAPSITGDVFRADWNGRVVNLTHSPWQDSQPLVSPNGKLVAFLSDRGGSGGLWVVGTDGTGLRRVPALGFPSDQSVQMAWSPDSRTIALTSGTVKHYGLSLATPGGRPRALAHEQDLGAVSWSPDGKLVTVLTMGEVDAYTPAGKKVWTVTSGGGPVGWSRLGFFATGPYDGRIHVVDMNGNERFSLAATFAAWSPEGGQFASVNGKRLEISTYQGRLVRYYALPLRNVGISWASDTGITFGDPYTGGGYRLDLTTGKVSPFDPGSSGLNTNGSATRFAVRDGTHVYTHVIGCDDDGGPSPAIASLQRVPHSSSIVYQSECDEPFDNLYSIAPDGTGLRRITNDQAEEVTPQLSPDRTRIAYSWSVATGLSCKGCPSSLRTIGVDGSAATTLTSPLDCAFDGPASWSPDGTQIMYVHSECDTAPDAMLIAAGGGTPMDLHVPAWTLAWGPTRIAYANGQTDPTTVWTALPDGTARHRVAAIGGGLTEPAWSADGRLAYLVGTTVVVNGSKVALPFAQVRSIAWSPDGTRFLVAAKAKGTPTFDLYTVSTDGTDVQRLTENLDVSSGDWR
jgi:Tol biopolymer transport system component